MKILLLFIYAEFVVYIIAKYPSWLGFLISFVLAFVFFLIHDNYFIERSKIG